VPGGRTTDLAPAVVVVGAASRDLDPSDPRGWRLGGGVSYGSLTLARLGLSTGAVVGVDGPAGAAWELDLLRAAGVEVVLAPLARGPVFLNVEGPEGRVQRCVERSDPVPVQAMPPTWRDAPTWMFAPVAAELPESWAAIPPSGSTVAVGWQGLLRELVPGSDVRSVAPWASMIVARANLVGLSRDDVSGSADLEALCRLLRPGATLAVTSADRGGLVLAVASDGSRRMRIYPAVPPRRVVDPTGAGDVFLAALMAARLAPRRGDGALAPGSDLLLAAAAASLAVEDHGLLGVPDRAAVLSRMTDVRASLVRPPDGAPPFPGSPASG
jgi:sugar/nucleoside kinase (ribokinase family)